MPCRPPHRLSLHDPFLHILLRIPDKLSGVPRGTKVHLGRYSVTAPRSWLGLDQFREAVGDLGADVLSARVTPFCCLIYVGVTVRERAAPEAGAEAVGSRRCRQ